MSAKIALDTFLLSNYSKSQRQCLHSLYSINRRITMNLPSSEREKGFQLFCTLPVREWFCFWAVQCVGFFGSFIFGCSGPLELNGPTGPRAGRNAHKSDHVQNAHKSIIRERRLECFMEITLLAGAKPGALHQCWIRFWRIWRIGCQLLNLRHRGMDVLFLTKSQRAEEEFSPGIIFGRQVGSLASILSVYNIELCMHRCTWQLRWDVADMLLVYDRCIWLPCFKFRKKKMLAILMCAKRSVFLTEEIKCLFYTTPPPPADSETFLSVLVTQRRAIQLQIEHFDASFSSLKAAGLWKYGTVNHDVQNSSISGLNAKAGVDKRAPFFIAGIKRWGRGSCVYQREKAPLSSL